MTRATALLIVLALTGTPVAALACAGLCRPAADDSAAACHDQETGTTDLALSPSHTCETPSDALFVVPRATRAHDELAQPAAMLLTIADRPRPAWIAAHRHGWRGPAPPVTSQLRTVVLRI